MCCPLAFVSQSCKHFCMLLILKAQITCRSPVRWRVAACDRVDKNPAVLYRHLKPVRRHADQEGLFHGEQ